MVTATQTQSQPTILSPAEAMASSARSIQSGIVHWREQIAAVQADGRYSEQHKAEQGAAVRDRAAASLDKEAAAALASADRYAERLAATVRDGHAETERQWDFHRLAFRATELRAELERAAPDRDPAGTVGRIAEARDRLVAQDDRHGLRSLRAIADPLLDQAARGVKDFAAGDALERSMKQLRQQFADDEAADLPEAVRTARKELAGVRQAREDVERLRADAASEFVHGRRRLITALDSSLWRVPEN